jgi:PST family polysaccharide transporter
MGGAQVVVLAVGFIRAKVIALTLGASGVGLIGIFSAFSGNVSAFAGWGLGTSGVRLIAGSAEEERATKIAAVRRMGWILSLTGLALGLLTFWPAAAVTFDSTQYLMEMAIVSLAVPCVIASAGWSAILQASGKIASLARVQVASALGGLLLGLPSIYLWGTVGIAVSVLLAAAVPAAVLWRAARRVDYLNEGDKVESADLRQLVQLGGALMIVGWLGQLSAYVVRLAIVRQEGLEAAGYYQAAYAISGGLPGFIFAAMGADFFPRVAAAKDHGQAVEVVERQIQAGLLLSVPFIAILIMFKAEWVRLLYAPGLDPASGLVPWMSWAVFTRIISWPIGFWFIARGAPMLVVVIESMASLATIVLSLIFLKLLGGPGAAIGGFIGSVAYLMALAMLLRVKARAGFSPKTWLAVFAAIAVLIFAHLLSSTQAPLWALGSYGLSLAGLSAWGYFKATRATLGHDDER